LLTPNSQQLALDQLPRTLDQLLTTYRLTNSQSRPSGRAFGSWELDKREAWLGVNAIR